MKEHDLRVNPYGDIGTINKDEKLEAKNAYPYIYDAIKNNEVVIINESHNIPLHRVLLYTLTDSFNAYGVQSVFLETLAYTQDDSIVNKKYPKAEFGPYASENIYNQTIRKMMRLNINLYSYEHSIIHLDTATINVESKHTNSFSYNKNVYQLDTTTFENKTYLIDKDDNKWEPFEMDNFLIKQFYSMGDFSKRDVEQAIKIYRKMRKNKITKTVIFCGYDHSIKNNGCMAYILQHLLKSKVFVINQTLLNEHSEKKYENSNYIKFANTAYPFVLFKNNRLFHSDSENADTLFDMIIGSPITVYKNNRPPGLELNGDRRRYALSNYIDVKKNPNDFLTLVYNYDEYNESKKNAIPIDAFQVQNGAINYDMILNPNKKYHLIAFQNKEIIIDKIIEVH